MVVGLDDGVVVGDEDRVAAHHGADGGAGGERDLVHAPADDPRGLGVAVGDRLDGLGRAAAQAVHHHHVTPAHVREQRADGRLLG